MKTTTPITSLALAAFVACIAVANPAQASTDHGMLQARMKVSLNEMVTEVKEAETPAAKRAVMERFLDKFENRSRIAERLPLNEEHRTALTALQSRFAGYTAELNGSDQQPGVADDDLDAFAGFMQQDLEQADSWGSGGIYLSTGAVIIILLILILIT
jgi:hypothetical protein